MEVPPGPIDTEWVVRFALSVVIAAVAWWAKQQAADKTEARKEVSGLIATVTELTGSVREMKDVTRLTYDTTRENKSTIERVERRLDQVLYDRTRDR